jgi:hypothetical protein
MLSDRRAATSNIDANTDPWLMGPKLVAGHPVRALAVGLRAAAEHRTLGWGDE